METLEDAISDDKKQLRRFNSVKKSFMMLFRPKLSLDSTANDSCDKKRTITRSQSFTVSSSVVGSSDQKVNRTMSVRLRRKTSSRNLALVKPIPKLDEDVSIDSEAIIPVQTEREATCVKHYDLSSSLPLTGEERIRQSLPIICSSTLPSVDLKLSSSFTSGFTAVSDNSQELESKPSNEDVKIRNTFTKEMSRKSPIRDYLSQSRCKRFHKLFKGVPEDEDPIDYYSCAFKGDILLQGFMYVSPNWVCFYSKIKGRGRLLEINLEKVISVTREKMALFIPNAIGIQTADKKPVAHNWFIKGYGMCYPLCGKVHIKDLLNGKISLMWQRQYVFGSFMSRDTTFRLLVSLWRLSQDSPDSIESSISSVSESKYFEAVTKVIEKGNRPMLIDNLSTRSNSDSNDESDASSMCLQCGLVDMGDRGDTISDRVHRRHAESSITSKKSANEPRPYFYFVRFLDFRKLCRGLFHFAVKLLKIPRTSLMLAVCSILVLFLLISAICMTYKVLLIQAKLEMRSVWFPGVINNYHDYVRGIIYAQEAGTHTSVMYHLHSVLKSNIQILEQIQSSLQALYSQSMLNTCIKMDCT